MTDDRFTTRRVLVVAAHPDDPEFGCAGSVARWAAEGHEIHYVLLTSGDNGYRDPGLHPGQVAATRESEQRDAASVLGVRSVRFLRYPDGMLEYTMDLRRRLCGIVRQVRPHTLVTIDPWRRYQLHPDHRVAGLAAIDGVRAAWGWNTFPEQLAELSPWRLKEILLFWTDSPDYWVDVTDYMERRLEALWRHASQTTDRREELADMLRERAREAGRQIGCLYAEAFHRLPIRPPLIKTSVDRCNSKIANGSSMG